MSGKRHVVCSGQLGENKKARKQKEMQPLTVACRFRPVQGEVCLEPTVDNWVRSLPRHEGQAPKLHKFEAVFDENASQQEMFQVLGRDMVADLLTGKNGLLMAYGITSSGKTYTMIGDGDAGLMPRSIKCIFNSLPPSAMRSNVVVPDRKNGFELSWQTPRAARIYPPLSTPYTNRPFTYRTPKSARKLTAESIEETTTIPIDTSMFYSVFVSFVDLYNDYFYDVLSDNPNEKLKDVTKSVGDMSYIPGLTEHEVSSLGEALALLNKGLSLRQTRETALNAESSRSHSIFTIRLVRFPQSALQELDDLSEPAEQLLVSQLSLVDLAGSERAARTNNDRDGVNEAGKINNSLRTLRDCLRAMRDNLKSDKARPVPFRDSKLTKLFRSYFEGHGKVKMVICVNPHADNYAEILHVLEFAAEAQEVQIEQRSARPLRKKVRSIHHKRHSAAGRRKKDRRRVTSRLAGAGTFITTTRLDFLSLPASIGNPDPFEQLLVEQQVARDEVQKKLDEFNEAEAEFRRKLVEHFENDDKAIRGYEAERSSHLILKRQAEDYKRELEHEMQRRQYAERMAGSSENELRAKCARLEAENKKLRNRIALVEPADRQLRIIRQAVGNAAVSASSAVSSDTASVASSVTTTTTTKDFRSAGPAVAPKPSFVSMARAQFEQKTPGPPSGIRKPGIAQHRLVADLPASHGNRRRSRSGTLVHTPQTAGPGNQTMMQLNVGRRRSKSAVNVTQLRRSGEYVLATQNRLEKGVEVKVHHADIKPTCTGGVQVVMDHVEVLRTGTPGGRRQHHEADGENATPVGDGHMQDRCRIGVEGHQLPLKGRRARANTDNRPAVYV